MTVPNQFIFKFPKWKSDSPSWFKILPILVGSHQQKRKKEFSKTHISGDKKQFHIDFIDV